MSNYIFFALRIITPNGSISTPIAENIGSETIWLPAAPADKVTIISVLFQKPDSKVKVINTESPLFHKISLPSGEMIWFLFHHVNPMPLYIPKKDNKLVFNKLLPEETKTSEQDHNYRGIMFSFDGNVPSFYDAMVTKSFSGQ